ncbi:MAG: NAD-dependent epimerase/dehydratase family protein [Waddliaceae bacterium]
MMNKRVLITGCAGFIGYHLAKALQARGDFVVGLDNFNDYYSPKLKNDRADSLKSLGIDIKKADICDPKELHALVKTCSVTHVVHLAAQAGVRYSIEAPHTYVKSNLEGFVHILELCRAFPHLKLTYASSSSVYGLNEKIPFSEQDKTDNQASLYGATKKANELLASSYHHLYKIPVTGLRFFTVYGPYGRPDMAYYSFTRDILSGKPISLFNQGMMQRDFTYVDDIVDGIIKAVDLGAAHEIFNLGNNRPVTLLDFVQTLEKAIGIEAEKKHLPMQKGDVTKTFADISHSQKRLGFSPRTDLAEGLQKFVNWYRHYNAI